MWSEEQKSLLFNVTFASGFGSLWNDLGVQFYWRVLEIFNNYYNMHFFL